MPASKHRRRGKIRPRPQPLPEKRYRFTEKGRHLAKIAIRAAEMYPDEKGTLTEDQWRAAVDSLNAHIETWNAMEAMCCDALGVEVPPPAVGYRLT